MAIYFFNYSAELAFTFWLSAGKWIFKRELWSFWEKTVSEYRLMDCVIWCFLYKKQTEYRKLESYEK